MEYQMASQVMCVRGDIRDSPSIYIVSALFVHNHSFFLLQRGFDLLNHNRLVWPELADRNF